MINQFRALYLTLAASVALFMSNTYAADLTMVFECSDGKSQTIVSENLEMIFSNDSLIASNGINTLEIPLSKLTRFFFSDSNTGVTGIGGEETIKIEVATISGVNLGTFESMEAVRESLPEGIYLINVDGSTHKMIIR